eukprot:1818386-Rhodomonas_salina.1
MAWTSSSSSLATTPVACSGNGVYEAFHRYCHCFKEFLGVDCEARRPMPTSSSSLAIAQLNTTSITALPLGTTVTVPSGAVAQATTITVD